jgi:transposase-like protein
MTSGFGKIKKIERIFFATSREDALNMCDKPVNKDEDDRYVFVFAKKIIQDIESYFCFSLETRTVIASTSIIKHLELVIRAMIGELGTFQNIFELLGFFYAVSDQVLSEKWFEPLSDWGNVMKELKAFFGGRISS